MERSYITFAQAQAAMNAMLEAAQKRPEQPVAIAIVDDAGLMVAYHQMDNLTVFARRHSIRKAYTGAITGRNSGEFGELMKSRGMTVRELGGDLELTPGLGGVVIRAGGHAAGDVPGNVMGGIGVGGYPSGQDDEDLAMIGLKAMKL